MAGKSGGGGGTWAEQGKDTGKNLGAAHWGERSGERSGLDWPDSGACWAARQAATGFQNTVDLYWKTLIEFVLSHFL